MTEVGTAVPANVNLAKSKPFAVSAYSRRIKYIGNNAQSFGPQADVMITMDTSTPGSFIDPLQSYLKFDLEIRNYNPFIDFVSFGKAGAASLIEEFRIFIQGNPVEEILQYNLFYELMMNQNGQCQQPLKMFRQSTVQQPVSEIFSTNAIKSPMYSLGGSPMFGTVVGSAGRGPKHSTYLMGPANTNASLRFAQSQATGYRTQADSIIVTPTEPFYSATLLETESYLMGTKNGTSVSLTSFRQLHSDTNAVPLVGSTRYGYGALPSFGSTVQYTYSNGFSDVDTDPNNAFNWPFYMPAEVSRPDLKTLGPNNLQDYFMFLANTKFIPVGIQGKVRSLDPAVTSIPTQATWKSKNFANAETLGFTAASIKYTCCIPLISGMIGAFADKCLPTMLMAPGSSTIQLKLTTPEKAFKVSMDPCRRILGTIRDYMPYGGSMGGLFGQLGNQDSNVSDCTYQDLNGNNLTAYLPANINATDAYGILQAPSQGYYGLSTGKTSLVTGWSLIGASLASANVDVSSYVNSATPSSVPSTSQGPSLCFRPYSVAAMEGRWTSGCNQSRYTNASIYDGATLTKEPAYENYFSATDSPANFEPGPGSNIDTNGVFISATPLVPYDLIPASGTIRGRVSTTFSLGPGGIPLPQYYLTTQPWKYKTFYVSLNANNKFNFYGYRTPTPCAEWEACYGSFLPSSVAQTRRCFQHNSQLVTFAISNVEFVTQQIILPEAVTGQILSMAASGDISITSTSVHNYQTPIIESTSQNLIIPAKVASANTMYCLFMPQTAVVGNQAQMYNSFRGVNPFAGVFNTGLSSTLSATDFSDIYTSTTGSKKLGGTPTIFNTPASNSPFQIQLRIGNELLPQQPITNVSELLTENIKAAHKLFDTVANIDATFAFVDNHVGGVDNNDIKFLAFDSIRDGDFCTAFVSADLLDDQTAIGNPAQALVWDAWALSQNTTVNYSDKEIPRSTTQLPLFTPPESTFVIAFDMETWSRYSDVTRSGKYLGQNTITLTLQNATGLGNNLGAQSNGFVLQTFVVHDVRYSFQAGGLVQTFM